MKVGIRNVLRFEILKKKLIRREKECKNNLRCEETSEQKGMFFKCNTRWQQTCAYSSDKTSNSDAFSTHSQQKGFYIILTIRTIYVFKWIVECSWIYVEQLHILKNRCRIMFKSVGQLVLVLLHSIYERITAALCDLPKTNPLESQAYYIIKAYY